ncbi:unnamed protein product [Euphydryas editha]|uniref:Uncharacterized protein n=1 Tax=Euphydryas editha TaxID=104508 RepID=A0AAU9TRS1_EUPED|nr:unnamed protein product [Euphydryas editha]
MHSGFTGGVKRKLLQPDNGYQARNMALAEYYEGEMENQQISTGETAAGSVPDDKRQPGKSAKNKKFEKFRSKKNQEFQVQLTAFKAAACDGPHPSQHHQVTPSMDGT